MTEAVSAFTKAGAQYVAVGRVTLTTGGVQIVPKRDTRRFVHVKNLGGAAVDIGPLGTATGAGFSLAAGATILLELSGALYGVTASGTISVAFLEGYDG